jgi:hypothetical protein
VNPEEVCDPNYEMAKVFRNACPVLCGLCLATSTTVSVTPTTTVDPLAGCAEDDAYSLVPVKPQRIKNAQKLPTETTAAYETSSLSDCKKECAELDGCELFTINDSSSPFKCHFYKNRATIFETAVTTEGTSWDTYVNQC